MLKEEFKNFMDHQITEILKYKNVKEKNHEFTSTNDCVFEWINKNAKKFRKKWQDKYY